MKYTKQDEINALERLMEIAQSKETYISEFLTPDILAQMIGNIKNDFPVHLNLRYVPSEDHEREVKELTDKLTEAANKRVSEHREAKKRNEQLAINMLLDVEDGKIQPETANAYAERLIGLKETIMFNLRENFPLTIHQKEFVNSQLKNYEE